MQRRNSVGVLGGQVLCNICPDVTARNDVAVVPKRLHRLGNQRCHAGDGHSGLRQIMRKRETRQCGRDNMQIIKQGKQPFEPKHRVRPTMQQNHGGPKSSLRAADHDGNRRVASDPSGCAAARPQISQDRPLTVPKGHLKGQNHA